MKIITVCSYYGTGSSAVTDFISEFDNVKSFTNFEFRFAHDPDGLADLEYHLIENFNRHNSGHALKRFKKFVDYYSAHFMAPRYEAFFHGNWKKLAYEYIDSLTDFSYPGIWQFDFYDKGRLWEFWHKLPNRIIHKLHIGDVDSEFGIFSKEITLASHPTEQKFLYCTKNFTDSLFSLANPERKPFLMVDQLLPSSNIEHHMRYFSNIQAIVVDRDPRDLYLLSKYVWKSKIVPSNIDLFCKWFSYARTTRETENWNSQKILFIQFEDLIYNYDDTTNKIMSFLNLSKENHLTPRKYFIPEVSIKNTRLWKQNPSYAKEAEYIANKLPQYLYHLNGE